MRNILFMFLIFVLVLVGISYAADPVVERPVYSAGDYWVFTRDDGKTTKLEFLREEKDRYIFNQDGVQVVKDFDLTVEKRMRDYRGPLVKFPIKVGKVWTYDYEGASARYQSVGRQAKYAVAAYEQITVPAGTFWSFKITLSIYETIYWEKGFSTEYWYAPDVKQIIKSSKEGKILELKEYKIK
ncbi:MAG: hypothetical protein OEW69_06140 [Nitrospirota bacterium]|nr:hypothetical protein [Nitrospirota bacterium]